MFKKILFIYILFSNLMYSQLSDKHWIPPLHARDASTIQDHYLYLSTAETTPFLVTVTDGSGVAIPGSPYSISATNSEIINIGTGQNTKMFLDVNEVNTVISDKGIILEGSKDFYVSFRMRHNFHSETLISKGRPGIGTSFRLGCMINETNDNRKSFVASVMATEDNTTMTLSEYNSGVIFVSGTGLITDDSQTFTLNAGESVIFSGYSNSVNNLDGIIGALVTSDKPVAVNTGNALGGITNNRGDFTLDQIVSASQIGTDYIFIEGNGLPTMELPLIVANEDNTEIYVNGGTTPVSIINAGDYYLVDNSFYQGTNNKNIFVRTTKPVFAYQLLGGNDDTATAGLNFIPPLSCFFQNSVNIPAVNQIGNDVYTADLMILTYTTATLTINGNAIPTTQAEPVLGNTEWVTYRISNINGDANVSSTGPLAVGVFGYQGNASGFAGYYSGFGSNPEDTAVTICSNQTINLFEAITGNPGNNGNWTIPAGSAPLVSNVFDPAVNIAGDYFYNIPDCNNPLVSIPIKVTVTIEQAPFAGNNNNIAVCANDNPIDLFTLLGAGAITGGTWSPALASGTGIFDPAVDVGGDYVYTITGNAVCLTASATVTVTNNPQPTIATITDYELCDDAVLGTDADGISFFDLTTKDSEAVGTQTGIAVTYHVLPNEAELGTNAITTINSANTTIHVRLTNTTTNCYNVTSFNLVVLPLPIIDNNIFFKQCDVDNDAVTIFNLTEANGLISPDASYLFSYHNSLAGAQNNTDFVADEINHIAANGSTVWARITNADGCVRTSQVNLVVSATTIPQTYRYQIDDVCDDYIDATDPDGDGIGYFDLTEIEPELIAQFPAGQTYTFSYFLTQNDAETEQNAIVDFTNFRKTTANNQLIWVRIESNLYDCAGLGPFLELIVNPLPDVNLGEEYLFLCVDPQTGIGAQIVDATPVTPGNYSYVWTPANPNGDSPIYTISSEGTYSVLVTNTDTQCVKSDQITAIFSSEPAAFEANLITPAFSSGLAAIEGVATGGFGTYEYSLNAIDWQSSPIFSNLQNGSYIVYVRDIQGCGILFSDEIQTITYPNFFTPNNDGYNDFWNIRLPSDYNGALFIFDRYGKFLKQLNPSGQGWDGTFIGKPLPSTDYWFRVEYTENNIRKEFKSHFSLKR